MEAKEVPSLSGAGGSDVVCRCLSGYQKRDHALGWWGRDTTCLEQTAYDAVKSYDTGSADTVTYRDLVGESGTKTVESKLLAQLLIASASGCRRAVRADVAQPRGQPLLRGNEACQALANLCVLQMYDQEAPSCELYREMQLASETEVNEESEWKARLPALYYTQGSTVYTSNDVPLKVSLKGEASRLTYVLPTLTSYHSPYHSPRTTHHAPRTTTTHHAPHTTHHSLLTTGTCWRPTRSTARTSGCASSVTSCSCAPARPRTPRPSSSSEWDSMSSAR